MPVPLLIVLYGAVEVVIVAAIRGVLADLILDKIAVVKDAKEVFIAGLKKAVYDGAEFFILRGLEISFRLPSMSMGDNLDGRALTLACNAAFGTAFTDLTSKQATQHDAMALAVVYLAQALEIPEDKLKGRAGVVAAVQAAAEIAIVQALTTGEGAFAHLAGDLESALESSVDQSFSVIKQGNKRIDTGTEKEIKKREKNRERQKKWQAEHSPYEWVEK